MPLSSNQRTYLKGRAHHLNAVVQIGNQGLTETVIAATLQALVAHELIKVKIGQSVEAKKELARQLEEATRCECVQFIGRTAVLYKRNPQKPVIVLPKYKGTIPKKILGGAIAPTASTSSDLVDDSDETDASEQ